MKFIVLTNNNVVKQVYTDVHNPVIYPDGERVAFSNGKIENIGKNYLLVEDHVNVAVGQKLDESDKDYDQSNNFLDIDFQGIKEDVKETVEEAKEEIKGLVDGKEGDKNDKC